MSGGAPLQYADLRPGDRFPGLRQRTSGRPEGFAVDTLAGRYIVLCPFMTAADPLGRNAADALMRERHRFDDVFASAFGISADPRDEADSLFHDRLPGLRAMWDFDRRACTQLGVVPVGAANGPLVARRAWIVLAPTLHVLAVLPFREDDPQHTAVFSLLDSLPPPACFGGIDIPPPVLVLPKVFEPELCRKLVGLYEAAGGEESGVCRDHAGVLDNSFKRRRDHTISDEALLAGLKGRIARRVAPEIERLFFMRTTRIERHIVACYSAEEGGHFRPHRDNGPGLTEHRRFAVSINLNDEFEGGDVCFPEYRAVGIKAPAGWALVFPCAILHAVKPVTRGARYAYLPFVYDDEGARIRERNLAILDPQIASSVASAA